MTTYMLDTNIASALIKNNMPLVRNRLISVPIRSVTVSVITQAELLYGVAKRGNPPALAARVQAFLSRVQVLEWTADVAQRYGDLRASCEQTGVTLAPINMMIAAHASAVGAVLVTRDQVFNLVSPRLLVEDWSVSAII